MPEAQQAAGSAASAADAASVQNLPEALDEFGRDMNVEKRRQVSCVSCTHCGGLQPACFTSLYNVRSQGDVLCRRDYGS